MKPSFLLLLLALPQFALAQDGLTLTEADILPRLVDHACLVLIPDLNGCEAVILTQTPDGTADLIILEDWRNDEAKAPLLISRNFTFGGPMGAITQHFAARQRQSGDFVGTIGHRPSAGRSGKPR